MNIVARYLDRNYILLCLDVVGKEPALEAIAAHLARRHLLDGPLLARTLIRRERSASTAVGHGLAIPHARLRGIDQPIVLVARGKQPIAFNAPDDQPISSPVAIVVPQHATGEHLKILGNVAGMFSSENFRAKLAGATDENAVFHLLAEWPDQVSCAG